MKISQRIKILKYLESGKSLTRSQAKIKFGCERLAPRITELRKQGYDFDVKMIPVKNRFNETVYVAKYTLSEFAPEEGDKLVSLSKKEAV